MTLLKTLHILSAAVILGTGFGIAFFTWFGYRSALRTGEIGVLRATMRLTVIADTWFTAPAVAFQALSGVALMLFAVLPMLLGMAAHAQFPGLDSVKDSQKALPTLMTAIAPVWVGALALAARRPLERRQDAVVGLHRLERARVGVADVVDERAEHRLARQDERPLAARQPGGVEAGEEPRPGVAHVALDARDLAGEEEAGVAPQGERRVEEPGRVDDGALADRDGARGRVPDRLRDLAVAERVQRPGGGPVALRRLRQLRPDAPGRRAAGVGERGGVRGRRARHGAAAGPRGRDAAREGQDGRPRGREGAGSVPGRSSSAPT